MAQIEVEALVEALGQAGVAIAIVTDGAVSSNEAASRLPDIAGLAREAGRGPVMVHVGETPWEVRAVRAGDGVVVVGQEVAARERLRGQVTAADELLSFASHELKGPLHVLGMACHLIETRARRGQPVEESNLAQLRRQVARLARLINELLDYARAREGRLEMLREEVDLVAIARAAAHHAEETRPADLRIEAPAGEVPARADRQRIEEVVGQLIDNAVRYTPSGTRIEVKVEAGRQPTITVADRGPGVAAGDRAGLFEPHLPRRGAARPTGRGLGLGLYLARAVARAHGGELEYAPGKPTGSSFTLRLPR